MAVALLDVPAGRKALSQMGLMYRAKKAQERGKTGAFGYYSPGRPRLWDDDQAETFCLYVLDQGNKLPLRRSLDTASIVFGLHSASRRTAQRYITTRRKNRGKKAIKRVKAQKASSYANKPRMLECMLSCCTGILSAGLSSADSSRGNEASCPCILGLPVLHGVQSR